MRALLDTHAFLWFVEYDPQLSPVAKSFIEDKSNEIFISHASIWEMSIKYSIGKLKMPSSTRSFQNELLYQINLNDFLFLPISLEHILEVSGMPLHHRDPFDRLLISQALYEKMPIISADIALDQYRVQRIW